MQSARRLPTASSTASDKRKRQPFNEERLALFYEKSPLDGGSFTMKQPYYTASLAFSARAVKAAGSEMASSESTLRLMSTPATFRPLIMRE